MKVTSGDSIAVTIGSGGGSVFGSAYGVKGGSTTFNDAIVTGGFGGGSGNDSISQNGTACQGGGLGGGSIYEGGGFPSPHGLPSFPGHVESITSYGGASGSSDDSGVSGATCEAWPGGASAASSAHFKAGGGAASMFGTGGDGGNDDANGHSAAHPGAGGGGAGARNSLGSTVGGSGADGACLVEWFG